MTRGIESSGGGRWGSVDRPQFAISRRWTMKAQGKGGSSYWGRFATTGIDSSDDLQRVKVEEENSNSIEVSVATREKQLRWL